VSVWPEPSSPPSDDESSTLLPKLGTPYANAGNPEILEMPARIKAHLARIQKQDRFSDAIRDIDWSFQCVEIDPLLAFQIHIGGARSTFLGDDLPDGCSPKHLVAKCLPQHQEAIRPKTVEARGAFSGSYSLEAPTRNLQFRDTGLFETGVQDQYVMGALVGVASPFVQVMRFEGRCYLTNGYHRALAASKKGATHIPCIFGDTKAFRRTGAGQEGSLPRELFESDNAPTVGHYTGQRATALQLKRFATKIEVTWEVSFPELVEQA